MAKAFLQTLVTPAVRRAQAHYYGREARVGEAAERDPLNEEELAFIAERDSFYLATMTENGWPYVQHRGGAIGFLRAVNPSLLAFADYRGNRQLLSTGNITANNRVSLFLMDYPNRTRLKIIGHARVADAAEHPELLAQLAEPEIARVIERFFFIDVLSFDWNCEQYINPRYTLAEVDALVSPLKRRIAELETTIAAKG